MDPPTLRMTVPPAFSLSEAAQKDRQFYSSKILTKKDSDPSQDRLLNIMQSRHKEPDTLKQKVKLISILGNLVMFRVRENYWNLVILFYIKEEYEYRYAQLYIHLTSMCIHTQSRFRIRFYRFKNSNSFSTQELLRGGQNEQESLLKYRLFYAKNLGFSENIW